LDFADVMIRDYPGDTGAEPSPPPSSGNWGNSSDIVIRWMDDDVFFPDDVNRSGFLRRGHDNYVYVRVTNNGPADALNVMVRAWVPSIPSIFVSYGGSSGGSSSWDFHWGIELILTSAISSPLRAGTQAFAKFVITKSQVEDIVSHLTYHKSSWKGLIFALAGGYQQSVWAEVTAENDYAYNDYVKPGNNTGANLIVRRNNLAQRNFSVIGPFVHDKVVTAIETLRRLINPVTETLRRWRGWIDPRPD